MTGGLQVQANETFQALSALGEGLSAGLFKWSESEPLADVYHFIGFPPHLHRIAELIHQARRPYVITVLLGSTRNPARLWLASARHFANAHVLRQRQSRGAITRAAAVLTITETDAEAVRLLYRLEATRVQVVPHGVSERFFDCTSLYWQKVFGNQPFVLCVGAIQKRKNQLLLVEACNHLRLPVVLLGPVLPGEKAYAQHVAVAAKQNEAFGGRWLQTLRNDDPLLLSAFAACRLFCLLSYSETQPISVLQAMAARRPVLLLRAPYTQNEPFRELPKVASTNREFLNPALAKAWSTEIPTSLSCDYTWRQVARRLQSIYEKVVEKQPAGDDFKS